MPSPADERLSAAPPKRLAPQTDENVQFTVYRPRTIAPGHWYPLVAFAHLSSKRPDALPHEPDPTAEVKRQAKAVLGERLTAEYQPLTQDASRAVPREETLTFVLHAPGIEFNPPLRTFRWFEAVHREEFRLRAGPECVGQTARGRLSVFLGDILLADVALAIPVDASALAPSADLPQESVRASPYRKIFASYSHKDVRVVEQFERLAKALGDDYLRDWQYLRAGEVWDARLRAMIEQADVFQLFWSRNAMESEYVRREWEHALSLRRPNFVRPTYWEEPLPGDPARGLPPAELSQLHFQRIGPLLHSFTPDTDHGAARLPPGEAGTADDSKADEPPRPPTGLVTIRCPRCGMVFQVLHVDLGRAGRCTRCHNAFIATAVGGGTQPSQAPPRTAPPPRAVPPTAAPIAVHVGTPPSGADMIRFGCPRCHTPLWVPASAARRKVACVVCGQRLQVPDGPAWRNKTRLAREEPPRPVAVPMQAAPPPKLRRSRRDCSALLVLATVSLLVLASVLAYLVWGHATRGETTAPTPQTSPP